MQRVGRYEILGELGRGAMGVVLRAMDPVIGRTIAIKTIRLSGIDDGSEQGRLRDRLFREARSAGMLSHPHIVTIYDIGQEGDKAYIAMEYVSGATLDELMKDPGRLDRRAVTKVLMETASALDYAHAKGIVHRDVKPSNIMLTDSGLVKITDFGVAKITSHQVTQTDMVLGTPSYMSPEQIEGSRDLDGRSDQFSLAVVAFELLTGEKPFQAETLPALLFKIAREDAPPVHRRNSSLKPAVTAVFSRALAKTSAERYATCTEFINALNESLISCTNWIPLTRGESDDQPTVTVPATEAPAKASAAANAGEPEPAAPFRASRREVELLSSQESSGVGKLALALLLLVVLGAGGFFTARQFEWGPFAPPAPPNVDQSAQQAPPTSYEPPPPAPVITPPLANLPASTPVAQAPPMPQTPVPPPHTGRGPEPQSGMVEFKTTPPGARVSVDDLREGCVTPCSMELAAGRHVIRYNLDGYRPAVSVLFVPQETHAAAQLDTASGTLLVISTPPGAQIFINGEPRGSTPASLKVAIGTQRVELRSPGLPPQSREIEVKDQQILNLEVNWGTAQ